MKCHRLHFGIVASACYEHVKRTPLYRRKMSTEQLLVMSCLFSVILKKYPESAVRPFYLECLPTKITSLPQFRRLQESWAQFTRGALGGGMVSSSLQSAVSRMAGLAFWRWRRRPPVSVPIRIFLKIMKQWIKALLCNWVNRTLFRTDSSRKSSKRIWGVIWEICVRNRTQLESSYFVNHVSRALRVREKTSSPGSGKRHSHVIDIAKKKPPHLRPQWCAMESCLKETWLSLQLPLPLGAKGPI